MSNGTVTRDQRDPRVFLAIERTFLAWTRTALALMGFGFVVARIGILLREIAGASPIGGAAADGAAFAQSSRSLRFGTFLVVLGVLIQALALVERHALARRFERGEELVPLRWSLSNLVGFGLLAVGVAMAVYLAGLLP